MELFDFLEDEKVSRPLTVKERTIADAIGTFVIWVGKRIRKINHSDQAAKLVKKLDLFEEKYYSIDSKLPEEEQADLLINNMNTTMEDDE